MSDVESAVAQWRCALITREARQADYMKAMSALQEAQQDLTAARGDADVARHELENALMKEISNDPT